MFSFELAMQEKYERRNRLFSFISASGKMCRQKLSWRAEFVMMRVEKPSVLEIIGIRSCTGISRYRTGVISRLLAFQAEHRFYCEDGKLHYEYDGRCLTWTPKHCSAAIVWYLPSIYFNWEVSSSKISPYRQRDGLGGFRPHTPHQKQTAGQAKWKEKIMIKNNVGIKCRCL